MYQKISYFTFKDVLDAYIVTYERSNVPSYPNEKITQQGWFRTLLSDLNIELNYIGIKANGTTIKQADIQGFIDGLFNIIYARHAYDYIYKDLLACDERAEDYIFTTDKFIKAFTPIINCLQLTMPKYIPILFQYVEKYEVPLDKIESISEAFNRFNDTPQNEQDEVDFNTDDYATTMGRSKAVTKADTGSLVERIRALQEAWKSTILEWANEFNDDFIYDNQLEEF